jgi:hypothetical protein
MPFAYRKRRALLSIVLLVLSVSVIGACSGSGGGGGGQPPPPTTHNTAPGTYSIPLAISSNGLEHKVTLTLKVE